MSKTYTFPAQEVLGGSVVVEVRTSLGSGTSTVTDKYFSDEIEITDETEFLGGELQSQYADFKIDYDKDNLFRDTIFASLTGVVDNDEFVAVKVTKDGATIFHGNIVPSTISITPFYSAEDDIESSRNHISFRCIWVLGLLNYITAEDVGNQILTSSAYYKTCTANDGLGTSMKFVNLISIMKRCLELVNSLYGFTVSINVSNDIPYVFFSKDRSVNPQFNGQYTYPNVTDRGTLDVGNISDSLFGVGVLLTKGDGTLGGIFQNVILDNDDNEQDNPAYAQTAYNLFTDVLKSFGLYASVTYSGSTIIIEIKTRVTGSQINISNIISASIVPFSELSRDGVNVSSKLSGNLFNKKFDAVGDSVYSNTVGYDFANDFDFPGGADPVNSVNSLMFSFADRLIMIRDMGVGQNLVSNPNFDGNINGWTAASGTWAYNALDMGVRGAGSARLTVASGNSAGELQANLSSTIFDYLIVSCWFYVTGITISAGVSSLQVVIRFYNDATLLDIPPVNKELAFPYTDFLNTPVMFTATCRMPGRTKTPITKIGIRIVGADLTGGGFVYIDAVQCLINRKGTPELAGTLVEDYFANGRLERRKYVVDGARDDIHCGDYALPVSEKLYVKKNKYKLRNNEAEIETINYPY